MDLLLLQKVARQIDATHSFPFAFLTAFSKDLQVTLADPKQLKAKPDIKDLVFGKYFTDHMLRIKWSQSEGWSPPAITPLQDLTLHPAAKVSTHCGVLCYLNAPFRPRCCTMPKSCSKA